MKGLHWANAFGKDVKRIHKRNYSLPKLNTILTTLQSGEALSASARPHILKGEWVGVWECRIAPDWLLIYQITETQIRLFRTGTHADLFE
jgi:mRNA interferase YafQ